MDSLASAIDKVTKVYESCVTLHQFSNAHTYKRLFFKMYANHLYEGGLQFTKEITKALNKAEGTAFQKIVYPKKQII